MRAYKGVVRQAARGLPAGPSSRWPGATIVSERALSSNSSSSSSSSAAHTSPSTTDPSPGGVVAAGPVNVSSSSSISRRKRRLGPSSSTAAAAAAAAASSSRPAGAAAVDRWGRVVPASHRMLEFLRGSTPTGSATAAAVTASSSSPSTVFSALQLARFYLGSGDLRAAQEVLDALQDGRLAGHNGRQPPLPAGLLRPLYQTLVAELCRRGNGPEAVEAARRMLLAASASPGEGQGVGKELLPQLIRACGHGGAHGGGEATLRTVLTELVSPPGAWREHAESCRALLEARAAIAAPSGGAETDGGTTEALPSLEEAWTALAGYGPPPVAAHCVRVEGLAARVATSAGDAGGDVGRLVEAVDAFAAAAAADAARDGAAAAQERERALLAAGAALVRLGGDTAALRQVLATLAVPGVVGPYVALMAAAAEAGQDKKGGDALDAVFEAAQAANPGPLPLGLILGYCRAALALQPAQSSGANDAAAAAAAAAPALDRALELLRGLRAGAAWAAEARPLEVGAVLEALCERGLAEEARALQEVAGPTFPSPPPVGLARALLKCAALEGRPGRAIALLRRVVTGERGGRAGESAAQTQARPGDYEAVLRALARMELPPPTAREAALGRAPLEFLAWAFDGLARSLGGSGRVTPAAVRLALGILRRACEWPEAKGEEGAAAAAVPLSPRHREALVQRAFALVSRLAAQGHETDDGLCEQLVGVAVWGVSLQRAAEVVRQMEATGAGKPALARAQALLVGSLAARGMIGEAEEALVKMVTLTGEGPTPAVLDAFARGYALEGNVPSGLSMLQGCFTQYGARPSQGAFEGLLARCLDEGDPYEAQRAVTIAQQLWGEEGAAAAWVRGLEERVAGHDFEVKKGKEEGAEAGDGGGGTEEEKS